MQSYYEIRYFSTKPEHKKNHAKQHALTRQWWSEYKEQTGEIGSDTTEMDAIKLTNNVVSFQQRASSDR